MTIWNFFVYVYCILFVHLSVHGCLGQFHVLALVHRAATNMGMHASLWYSDSFGYTHRRGITRLYCMSSFMFLATLVWTPLSSMSNRGASSSGHFLCFPYIIKVFDYIRVSILETKCTATHKYRWLLCQRQGDIKNKSIMLRWPDSRSLQEQHVLVRALEIETIHSKASWHVQSPHRYKRMGQNLPLS